MKVWSRIRITLSTPGSAIENRYRSRYVVGNITMHNLQMHVGATNKQVERRLYMPVCLRAIARGLSSRTGAQTESQTITLICMLKA